MLHGLLTLTANVLLVYPYRQPQPSPVNIEVSSIQFEILFDHMGNSPYVNFHVFQFSSKSCLIRSTTSSNISSLNSSIRSPCARMVGRMYLAISISTLNFSRGFNSENESFSSPILFSMKSLKNCLILSLLLFLLPAGLPLPLLAWFPTTNRP